jgi:hypothetical protein
MASKKVSKAEMVREALEVGDQRRWVMTPMEGVKWIRQKYGVDVSVGYFSAVKSKWMVKKGYVKHLPYGEAD